MRQHLFKFAILFLIFTLNAFAKDSDKGPAAVVLGQPLYIPSGVELDLNKAPTPNDLFTRSLYRGDWLRNELLMRLMQPYIKQYDIKVLPADLHALADVYAHGDQAKAMQLLQDKSNVEDMNKVILKWKIDQFLYKKFGGKVVMHYGGIEIPVGAQEAFFKQEEQTKHFKFLNPKYSEEFWYAFKSNNLDKVVAKNNIDFTISWWDHLKKNRLGKIYGLDIYDDGSGPNVGVYLRSQIIPPLIAKLISEKNIKAEPNDIAETVKAYSQYSLSKGESAESVNKETNNPKFIDSCKNLIVAWKVDRYLYKRYGGIVMFQQANALEPVGAIREFLKEAEKEGAFIIYNKEAAVSFWYYFDHPSNVIPKDKVNFDVPWWLQEKN